MVLQVWGTEYVAWAHDDFWSYSAALIAANQKNNPSTYFPIATYGNFEYVTGSGQLGIIVENQNGMANPAGFPDAVKEQGSSEEFHDVWGLGAANTVQGTTNPMVVTRPKNDIPLPVDTLLAYLHSIGGANLNTPVFGLDMQTAGSLPLELSGRVYIANPDGSIYHNAIWALDQIAQPFNTPSPGRGSYPGDPDGDWNGISAMGDYDPLAYGQAVVFPGGGHVDYFTYAPTMDLSLYDGQGLLFVVDFTIVNHGSGNTEVFIANAAPPGQSQVPEPATMLLLGLGLVGLAGIRRRMGK